MCRGAISSFVTPSGLHPSHMNWAGIFRLKKAKSSPPRAGFSTRTIFSSPIIPESVEKTSLVSAGSFMRGGYPFTYSISQSPPIPLATPAAMDSMREGIFAWVSGLTVLTVPSRTTSSAITLYLLPPLMVPMDTTAASRGLTFLDTTVWRALITWAEMAMASTPFSGSEPWAPFPFTVRNNLSEAPIRAPSFVPTVPVSSEGQTCMPKIASTAGFSKTPSEIIPGAPPVGFASSAGWKMNLTVPLKLSFSSERTRAAPSSAAV